MTARVEIKNLYKTYFRRKWLFGKGESFPVLKDVTLSLPENSVLGLVGESGCGKTTLCKVLLGIEKPTSGTVLADGKNTAEISKAQWKELRRVMQVVYQDPYSSLDPRMNVRQVLSEPLDIHGLKKDRAERETFLKGLLASVGMSETFLDRYPHEFSGGQRQRICIARALALEPKILVADEPVSALDVSVQAQILNLLKKIKQERQISMLFVTHDFAVARFLCDEIAVMYKGRIVERAPAGEIFTQPLHPYTRALLAAVPRVDGTGFASIAGTPGVEPGRENWACPFAPRCSSSSDACRAYRFELKEVTPHHWCACGAIAAE
ncbi:MAG: ATP-binding cassette domain-containing protein [Elusimicrobia bacterium]|nr:ATP-binding cassette domain-containing protein [Elusimicrobiota bacterium]MDY6039326.1 oligopeptide/dipeptide ABC transporter ATP-binding protein [Elusimicrobiaceae bacterium]